MHKLTIEYNTTVHDIHKLALPMAVTLLTELLAATTRHTQGNYTPRAKLSVDPRLRDECFDKAALIGAGFKLLASTHLGRAVYNQQMHNSNFIKLDLMSAVEVDAKMATSYEAIAQAFILVAKSKNTPDSEDVEHIASIKEQLNEVPIASTLVAMTTFVDAIRVHENNSIKSN